MAVLLDGQRITFAAGDVEVGSGLLCQSHGVNLGAWVPKPGHTTHAQYAGPAWTSEIQVRTRDDGVVIVRCSQLGFFVKHLVEGALIREGYRLG